MATRTEMYFSSMDELLKATHRERLVEAVKNWDHKNTILRGLLEQHRMKVEARQRE